MFLANNNYMNQILFNKSNNKKKVFVFKFQFILSVIFIIFTLLAILKTYNEKESFENISKSLDKRVEIQSIYNTLKVEKSDNIYFGKIIIEKISLEYSIFNKCDDELLKISPCKFYGGNIEEKGNICIAAHNYNDSRFFGKIDKLEIKDTIKIIDLKNNSYEYIIYDIFETNEDDLSILKGNKNYELTLLTCNNSNNKRIIIKAYRKEY